MTRPSLRRPWLGLTVGLLLGGWLYAWLTQRRRLRLANSQARVLVVGDEPLVMAHYVERLRRAGYQVRTLVTGPQSPVAPGSDWEMVLVCASGGARAETLRRLDQLELTGPRLVLQDHALVRSAIDASSPAAAPATLMGYPRVPAVAPRRFGPVGTLVLGESDDARTMGMGQAMAVLRRAGWRVTRRV